MKVLVVGSGAREHALVWKLKQSPRVSNIYCCPGNAGIDLIAESVTLSSFSHNALAVWAAEKQIDLTVVGPEAPLAEGIVDIFTEHGLKVFGPTKAAAKLEYSKSFAKEIMRKAGVQTPSGTMFTDIESAKNYVREHRAPIVVKADGLAAGKGVTVAETEEQAFEALDALMNEGLLGDAGGAVILEDKLIGEEASVMAIVDGDTVVPLVVSQDYKRLLDENRGPNTGGMGAISPTLALPDDRVEQLMGEIFIPVIRELWGAGIRYTGFLYAGVMIDRAGVVHVLEFNCRLGDPETQVLMMRLQSDLFSVLYAAVNGKLSTVDLRWSKRPAACVVACSEGYPSKVIDDRVITGLFGPKRDLSLFQAGTVRKNSGEIVTKGGRVLSVAALGRDVDEALVSAYKGLESVSFEGMHFRKDIGKGT